MYDKSTSPPTAVRLSLSEAGAKHLCAALTFIIDGDTPILLTDPERFALEHIREAARYQLVHGVYPKGGDVE